MNEYLAPEIHQSNILVVDDHPANLSLLMQILTGQGYKVRVSPNGNLALRSIQLMLPDLILLDINMPDMDGYTLCQHLKSEPQTKDIPVIFISALGETWDKVRGFTLGAVDYITKPFEPVEVLARIQHQLQWQASQTHLQLQNIQLQLLLSTTQAINAAKDVDSALEAILTQVCQSLGWDLGEAWIPDPEGNYLVCSPGCYVGDHSLIGFYDRTRNLKIAPNKGLVGKAWSNQQPQIIEDLSTVVNEDEFLSVKQAIEEGIRGVISIPVISQQEAVTEPNRMVVAVLTFFQKKNLVIRLDSLQLIMTIANQLSSFIQRKQAEDQLRELNLELKKLANLDGLTQVANRRRFDDYFLQEWSRAMREGQWLSLILCDVDYFKPYNDHYGHLAGDDCLQRVAQTMNDHVQRPADLVARYGGEEFVVLLPNTSSGGAEQVARNLQSRIQSLRLPHAQSTVKPYVTMSLGVASVIPRANLSPEDLISAADQALYQAKHQGRDRVVVSSPRRNQSFSPRV
ncbi:MAG: diguanylate cyclase [Coleofasciculaceae cyanobacterium SM2_1_6]|nr:diguanylate cyclase [Coleofasciculaceae cyanobacterium SM2_1_6]